MKLVRCNAQLLNRHEHRRIHRRYGNLNPLCGDILRSLNYWRAVRRSGEHAMSQYIGHIRQALGGRPLAQLRMAEAAIRCDVICREAVQAWRRVA